MHKIEAGILNGEALDDFYASVKVDENKDGSRTWLIKIEFGIDQGKDVDKIFK